MKQQITLSNFKQQAKKIQKNKNIKYNQALQLVATEYGYSTYQSFLKQVEHNFIEDTDPVMQKLKQNFWKHKEEIKALLKRLEKITKRYSNNSTTDEQIYDLIHSGDQVADKIAKLILNDFWYNNVDTSSENLFGYSIYTQVSYKKYMNDVDGMESDYSLAFTGDTLEFWINHRKFFTEEIEEDIEYFEWLDWEVDYRIIKYPL